jgi:hypothetical protein
MDGRQDESVGGVSGSCIKFEHDREYIQRVQISERREKVVDLHNQVSPMRSQCKREIGEEEGNEKRYSG